MFNFIKTVFQIALKVFVTLYTPNGHAWVFQWLHIVINMGLSVFLFIYFKDIIHLFLERGQGRQKEGWKQGCEREMSIACLSNAPNWGPGLQLRRVPWWGTELATFQRSIHWATSARTVVGCLKILTRGWQTFSVTGQIGNKLDFMEQPFNSAVAVQTSQWQ